MVKYGAMLLTRHAKFLVAKLLLATLLLQVFLPAWAGLSAKAPSGWTEVCVSSGTQWINQAGDKQADSGHAGLHTGSEHCLFCAVTGAAPEFDASIYLAGASGDSQHAALCLSFLPGVFPGHSLQSRAPPSFS